MYVCTCMCVIFANYGCRYLIYYQFLYSQSFVVMVIGNVVYQFILDCFFINHNLIVVMLRNNICIQLVSLMSCNYFIIIISMHMYISNIGLVDVNIAAEKLTALSSVHQLDYSQMDKSSHQYCVVHDGASDDRAEKCSVSSYCKDRRRYLSLHTTTTG